MFRYTYHSKGSKNFVDFSFYNCLYKFCGYFFSIYNLQLLDVITGTKNKKLYHNLILY